MSFQTLLTISLILWIILGLGVLLGLFGIVLPSFVRMRRQAGEIAETVKRLEPAAQAMNNVADNVNYLTAALRSDVEEVSRTLRRATETTNEVVDLTRERVAEINGFLEVVQEEAESSFLTTMSVLRGMRAGRLGGERERREKKRRRLG